jgi:hypothetical protein
MRTTLDIDADVLQAAKEIAGRTRRTAGQVLSDLARRALSDSRAGSADARRLVNGFEVLPAGDRVVTPEHIRQLMEESEVR